MKNQRQQLILDIINTYAIDTQEALIAKLKESGCSATQTTISRDINQLKLVKAVTSDGTYRYIMPTKNTEPAKTTISASLSEAVISIEAAKNIVVVKTLSGMANAVAVCIDSFNHDDIVGSVAGDDTIIIVTYDDWIAKNLKDKLKLAFKIA
jgi:transcriptional regulator of arginine metabolism